TRSGVPSASELQAAGFLVWSPVATPAELRGLVLEGEPRSATQAPPSKPRVLVVEDDAALRSLAEQLLEEAGYDVKLAASGRAGLEALEKSVPDVIVLDIMMPDIDGREVCRQIRARNETKAVPVIFVSAVDDLQEKMRAFDAGGNDFVCKPYDEAELLR